MAQTLGSYKNIAKTVSIRHQYYMCHKMTCSVKFLGVENTYGSGNAYIHYIVYKRLLVHCARTVTNILVNQLDFAAALLQMTELHVDSTVYRCIMPPTAECTDVYHFIGLPMLTSMEQNTLKVVSFYVPFGMMIHCLEN